MTGVLLDTYVIASLINAPDTPHLEAGGITLLPVTWRDSASAVSLPLPHKDPFDRILAATALSRGLIMLTADANLRRCPGLECVC